MSSLALFAETPQAGELGHRFLVPIDMAVSESEIAGFVQVVDTDLSIGENFVAVGRKVSQHSTTGAIREGRNVVVLAGIDVSRISVRELVLVLTTLQECLDKLHQLVSSGIDWSCMSTGEVIIRLKELQEWLDDFRADPLPVSEWRNGPRRRGTTKESLVHSPRSSICMKTWRFGVPIAMAFALGVAGGVSLDQLRFRRREMTAPDQATTTESAESHSAEPKSRSKGAPDNVPSTPTHSPVSVSSGIADLLRNAVHEDKVDALVDILALMPSNDRIPAQDFETLIKFASRLVEKRRFDDAVRIVNQMVKFESEQSLGHSMVAEMKDTQRKAREGCESIDQQDRILYESIREFTDKQQIEAARRYLERGLRQAMSRPVERWIKWAGKAIDAEVISINVPTDAPLLIKFVANGREIGCRLDSVDHLASSRPLAVVMTHIGITPQKLPPSVQVVVEANTQFPPQESIRFFGELQISKQSKGITRVKLQSAGLPRLAGEIAVRVPSIENSPELPEWTKESP